MLKPKRRIGAEQLLRNGERISPEEGLAQFRCELHGIQNLRELRRLRGIVIRADHVELPPALVADFPVEETIANAAQLFDFKRRRDAMKRQKAVLAEAGDLPGRQGERRSHIAN